MVSIVFAADSHLNKHYARMTPDQLLTRREQLRAAWKQSVDFALTEGADFYIHGGDLFDSPNPRAVELVWVAGQLQRLSDAGVSVLLIGGNHDIPKTRHHGATPQRLFEAVRVARVFTRPTAAEWHVETVRGVRVAIGGLPPDPRLGPDDDPLATLDEPIAPPDADATMLVTHYAVEGLLHPLAEEAVIGKASVADLAGTVDYVLVGHLHEGQELDIAGVKVLFPGPTERLSFGEMDVGCGFALLTIEERAPHEITSRHIHVDPQPMRRETVRATDIPTDDPTGFLIEHVRRCSAPDQILQLRLEGPLPRDTYQALRMIDVWHVGHDLNFYFDLDRHGLTVSAGAAPDLAYSTDQRVSPRAEIARVADGYLAAAESDGDRSVIEAARALVLERYAPNTLDDA